MIDFWQFLSDPDTQRTLSWLGGGLATLATGLWAIFLSRRKSSSTRSSGTTSMATGRDGIVSTGDVHVSGKLNITRGAPAWLILLGFAALFFLMLRVLAAIAALSPIPAAQAREIVSDAMFLSESEDRLIVLILLPDGALDVITVAGETRSDTSGSWTLRDDGSVCLDAVGDGSPSGCFRLVRRNRTYQLLTEHDGIEFDRFSALNGNVKTDVSAEELQGRWSVAYGCNTDVASELLDVRLQASGFIVAFKTTGNSCVSAGQVSWRGQIENGVISVQWLVKTDEKLHWTSGQINVLSREIMVGKLEIGSSENIYVFLRLD